MATYQWVNSAWVDPTIAADGGSRILDVPIDNGAAVQRVIFRGSIFNSRYIRHTANAKSLLPLPFWFSVIISAPNGFGGHDVLASRDSMLDLWSMSQIDTLSSCTVAQWWTPATALDLDTQARVKCVTGDNTVRVSTFVLARGTADDNFYIPDGLWRLRYEAKVLVSHT